MNIDPPVLTATCVHLRHKMMYVDDRQSVPGTVDDRSDTRIYWCMKTMTPLGPDGRCVNPASCSTGRSCFCASPSSH